MKMKLSRKIWENIGEKAGWIKSGGLSEDNKPITPWGGSWAQQEEEKREKRQGTHKFLVVDNNFNRIYYPNLIGKKFESQSPPSYAQVKSIWE